ncbi:DUF7427 family protein [Hoyosella altamirensis]|uniref:Uncharacterized protein n=1 Tax=Hoyosella altamirensis TaxID=616997 RepID=A0A839RTX6_9ACTN|nr:hypothetical protein [Hoyosella altamirensis]MBB3039809.1 hypothetical protein [Hoyosella altamirensis]
MTLTSVAAWRALIAGIVAYEIVAPPGELLTDGMDRWRTAHPVLAVISVWLVAAHLLRVVPPAADPLSVAGRVVGGVRGWLGWR